MSTAKDGRQVIKGRDVFIAQGATVIGDVRLGDNVSIWFGAVVRADAEAIRIGNRSNIQDACVLHADPGFPVEIGEQVTVGHSAIIHGAAIGNNTLIGVGSVLLNGVKLGRQCIVGAHSLLTEGTEIPDNSLAFGSPAKVIRILSDEEVDHNTEAAAHYVQNGLRYLGKSAPERVQKAPDQRLESLRAKPKLAAEKGPILTRNLEVQQKIYRESILPLTEKVFVTLEETLDFFDSFEMSCTGEAVGKSADKARIMAELKLFFTQTQHRYFNINFNWNNLKNGRQDAFGYYIPLQIELEPQHYHINRNNNALKTYSKRYDETLDMEEQQAIAAEILGKVLDYIEDHLQN